MKIYEGKYGQSVTFERFGAWWVVQLRDSRGEVADKMRCDDYRMAVEYRKAFIRIARA